MAAGAQPGCTAPCAPAIDRAVVRGYVDARLTGFLEWPVLDAMPPRPAVREPRPGDGRPALGGHYRVNAMTWAIAQLTQFAFPPARRDRRLAIHQPGQRLPAATGPPTAPTSAWCADRGEPGHGLEHDHRGHHGDHGPAGQFPRLRRRSPGRPVCTCGPATSPRSAGGPARGSSASAASTRPRSGRFSLTSPARLGLLADHDDRPGPRPAAGRAAAPLRLPLTESLARSGRPGGPTTSRRTWPPRTAPSS